MDVGLVSVCFGQGNMSESNSRPARVEGGKWKRGEGRGDREEEEKEEGGGREGRGGRKSKGGGWVPLGGRGGSHFPPRMGV